MAYIYDMFLGVPCLAPPRFEELLHQPIQPFIAGQDIDWLEYFAGVGNLTRVMVSAGCKAARFDLLDNKPGKHHRSNFMDLNHVSGFALHNYSWQLLVICVYLDLLWLHFLFK